MHNGPIKGPYLRGTYRVDPAAFFGETFPPKICIFVIKFPRRDNADLTKMDVVDEKAGVDIVNLLSGALGGKFVSFVPTRSAARIPHVWSVLLRDVLFYFVRRARCFIVFYAWFCWVGDGVLVRRFV